MDGINYTSLQNLVKKGLDKHLTHFEIAELWSTPQGKGDKVKHYEEKIGQAVCDGEILAEVSIRNPKVLGGFEVIPNLPTTLRQAKDGWLNGGYLQFTIHRDNFREWLIKSNQWPIANGCLLAKWFDSEPQPQQVRPIKSDSAGSHETKQRKKLKPLERDTNEGLLLVYEMFEHYNIEYLDELQASKAWGKIISKEFSSDLIDSISDAKKSISLKGGEKLSKAEFSEKYRRRFKAE